MCKHVINTSMRMKESRCACSFVGMHGPRGLPNSHARQARARTYIERDDIIVRHVEIDELFEARERPHAHLGNDVHEIEWMAVSVDESRRKDIASGDILDLRCQQDTPQKKNLLLYFIQYGFANIWEVLSQCLLQYHAQDASHHTLSTRTILLSKTI